MNPINPNNAKRGRILRLKTGYNPNSSSVGSEIPIFLAFAVASGAVTALVLNMLAFYDRRIRRQAGQTDSR